MKVTHFATRLSAALTMWVVAGSVLPNVAADEFDVRPDVVAPEYLAPQRELDAVKLSVVDEKLALSLAVEAHIQIELAQLALAGSRHEDLKRFTGRKLRHYRQLLNTLQTLTGGRAGEVVSRATRKTKGAAAGDDNPTTISNSSPARSARKSGIGDIVQNATANAIVRVRLAIAQEYAQLLSAELETAPAEEFDLRYLSVEGFNQMQVLAMLRVFEQQASPEFARIIHLAAVGAEMHASEARQIVEQIKRPPQVPPALPGEVVNTALKKL
jgi:predicted outer membrane protein